MLLVLRKLKERFGGPALERIQRERGVEARLIRLYGPNSTLHRPAKMNF